MESIIEIQEIQHRKRLPRRAKGELEGKKRKEGGRLPGPPNNGNHANRIRSGDLAKDGPLLEFVTITGPSQINRNETSRKIRTQVMRDYLRKQNRQAVTGVEEKVTSTNPEKPSDYKGRFKLDSWSHKTKTKALNARRSVNKNKGTEDETAAAVEPQGTVSQEDPDTQIELWRRREPVPILILDPRRLDPFDSLSVSLGPRSERLLVHYHSSYSMNSMAVNPEGDFFSQARTDPAVFHSILYLVALHHDLKLGISDSPESLYHGSEAFMLINQRLEEGIFSDMTIAAVAMLVTKENLNGKYDLSKIHMQGLEYMVREKGGISMLKGVFQRIVTWSDFCYANVWNCQPRFPRLDLHPRVITAIDGVKPNCLPPEHLFGPESPMIPIFHSLRAISSSLSLKNGRIIDRLSASNLIYETEFSLLNLNKENANDLEPTSCIYSFEAIPLKTAAHLFLYLVVREIPRSSQLIFRLVGRLHEALEIQLGGWWDSNDERRVWLLWMLFMGGAATAGRFERWWFVKEMDSACGELGIYSQDGLRDALKRVLWHDTWCSDHCLSLWNDLKMFEQGSSMSPESPTSYLVDFEQ